MVAPGLANAAASTATVPNGTAGTATNVLIQVSDAQGNHLTTGGATVAVSVTGANSAAATVTDHADGTYLATYTPTHTGTDSLAITLNGSPVGASPYPSVVAAAGTTGAASTANVPAGVAGAPTTIAIRVRDAFGNPRTAGADAVAVSVSGANAATAVVSDHGDGTYTATYTPTRAGNDYAVITVAGVALNGSPFTSVVSPAAADPAHCGATVPAGVAGQATAIVVQVRDTYGNLRTSGGDAVTVGITGTNPATPTVTDLGGGSYQASYTPTRAGTDQVAVTVAGSAIAGSPFASLVAPGLVDAQQSSFQADRASAAGDGSQPLTLTLVLHDAFGNRIAGLAPDEVVIAAEPAGGVTITGPATASDSTGTVTASVSSTSARTVTFSATARGVTLAATATVRFRPHYVLTLPAGRQFIGLPFTPDDPTPEAVLGASHALVKRWQPDAGAYTTHLPGDADPTGFFAFGPGRGLWFAPSAPLTLDLLGEPTPDGPFTFSVPVGWSNLGNPFDRDLPWTLGQITVRVDQVDRGLLSDPRLWDTVRPYLWLWNEAQGQAYPLFPPLTQPSIPRLAGFWAKALVPGVQLVVGAPAAGRARAAVGGPRDWQLALTAQQGDGRAVALVGASALLTRALPIEAPPETATGPLRLEVIQASGSRAAGELRAGADGAWAWELAVTVPRDGDVMLAWPSLLRSLPRGLVASLEDRTTSTTCLLNTHGSYRFAAGAGERRLRLICRYGHVERAEITTLSAVQGRGRGLTVSLSLSGPAEVTLRVRGLGGRLVKELTSHADGPGALSVGWDGTDQGGRPVPAGTYQLEATAVSSNGAVSRAVRAVTVR